MTPAGMIAFGAWLLFMGTAGIVSRRFVRPGARGKAFSDAMLGTLRRFHLAASDEAYEVIGRIMTVALLGAGTGLLIAGIVVR